MATIPYQHLGSALATDYFLVREQFGDAEWDHFIAHASLRRPGGAAGHQRATGSARNCRGRWCARLAELGIVGEDIEGYGCPA